MATKTTSPAKELIAYIKKSGKTPPLEWLKNELRLQHLEEMAIFKGFGVAAKTTMARRALKAVEALEAKVARHTQTSK